VTRGEPRIRPNNHGPGAGSSCLRRFSRPRYLDCRDTSGWLPISSSVPIDVHGSLDRAKDVSSSVSMLVRHRRVECVRLAHADDVPLLLLPEDTRCRRCDRLHGNEPRYRRFGPTEAHVLPSTREGRRRRVNQDAFHRCERGSMKRIAPPVTRAGLSLTPPTRCPQGWGQCAHRALQARRMCLVRGRDEPGLPPLGGHIRCVSLLALRLRECRFAFSTS
jgi:hypothetical protein